MPRNQDKSLVLVILAILVGLLLVSSISIIAMSGGHMGGMMGGGGAGLNPLWIALVVLLGIIFFILLALLLSSRQQTSTATVPVMPIISNPSSTPAAIENSSSQNLRAQELTIVKMLDEDERRLYTLIRERGGEMLQKDIVASKAFSKAKVTRLLDRLERKDVVVRERHGMTNKVRIVTMPPKSSEPA